MSELYLLMVNFCKLYSRHLGRQAVNEYSLQMITVKKSPTLIKVLHPMKSDG